MNTDWWRDLPGWDFRHPYLAAAVDPPAGTRQFWPEREVAIVQFLTLTGAGALRRPSLPLRHRQRTGDDLERRHLERIDATRRHDPRRHLDRHRHLEHRPRPPLPTDSLFTRRNGLAMTPSVLNHLLKALAARAHRAAGRRRPLVPPPV